MRAGRIRARWLRGGRGGAGGCGRVEPDRRRRASGRDSWASASSAGTSGFGRRVARSTAASTLGGGAKHARGTRRMRLSSYQAPQVQPSTVDGQTAVRFAASPHSTIASSCNRGTAGSPSSRRRIVVPAAKGRLATTANGSSGSGSAVASPSTISTRRSLPKRVSSCRSAAASSSTARTRAPAAASARVRTPLPAPRSSTSVPGATPASRTSSSANARLRSACRPRGRA